MRSKREPVTFDHPFTLIDLDGMQPAGAYMVVTEEEELSGLSFVAWKRISTVMYLPAIGISGGFEQIVTIDPQELAAAMKEDAARNIP